MSHYALVLHESHDTEENKDLSKKKYFQVQRLQVQGDDEKPSAALFIHVFIMNFVTLVCVAIYIIQQNKRVVLLHRETYMNIHDVRKMMVIMTRSRRKRREEWEEDE